MKVALSELYPVAQTNNKNSLVQFKKLLCVRYPPGKMFLSIQAFDPPYICLSVCNRRVCQQRSHLLRLSDEILFQLKPKGWISTSHENLIHIFQYASTI